MVAFYIAWAELSIRGGGRGFSPASLLWTWPPATFKGKEKKKEPLAVWFPAYLLYLPGTLKSYWQPWACPRLWNSGLWYEVRKREKNKERERERERGRNFALTPYPTTGCFSCSHLLASSSQSEPLEQATFYITWQTCTFAFTSPSAEMMYFKVTNI